MMSHEKEVEANERRWLILRAKIAEEDIKAAFRYFREQGIEPVLIKGWAAALEYPEKYMRLYGDIDLCVAPESFEKSRQLIVSEKVKKIQIDLHCGLRHLDTAGWETLFENSSVEYIDDVPVRILSREDHLRVLSVHWLTDGGAYKERLLDIFYLLQNHVDDFDWEKCFAAVDENRRQWIIKTIAVVHRYHKLDTTNMPFAEQLKTIPQWLSKALEKEWASDTKLQPIHVFWDNKKEFWKQLKKRFPPNAIQATIEMEGKFDESSRIFYQLGSIFMRLMPSIRRTILFIKSKNPRINNKNG